MAESDGAWPRPDRLDVFIIEAHRDASILDRLQAEAIRRIRDRSKACFEEPWLWHMPGEPPPAAVAEMIEWCETAPIDDLIASDREADAVLRGGDPKAHT